MQEFFSKYYQKLCAIRWIIGFVRCDIAEIIRSRHFDPRIHWIRIPGIKSFYADPFIYSVDDEYINILYEEFPIEKDYGRIALMRLDENFRLIDNKILLDINDHLSYPYIFNENGIAYIFPEAAKTGKLTCYSYDHAARSITFVQDIVDIPLLDSTILKYNKKYWLFGVRSLKDINYELLIFYSDNLLGPYEAHAGNPVRSGLNGSRFAGDFIKVDDSIYRPSQNCEKSYGESITIFRLKHLSESEFEEEFHMNIEINRKRRHNKSIHSIHTINSFNDLIVVDGEKWIFSPLYRLRKYIRGLKNK